MAINKQQQNANRSEVNGIKHSFLDSIAIDHQYNFIDQNKKLFLVFVIKIKQEESEG